MKTACRPSRIPLLILGFLLLSVPLVAAPVGVTVVVENRAPTNGTWLTPVWVGFHDGSFDPFDDGDAASVPLERLAEDGNTTPLSNFFNLSAGTGSGGVIAAGGAMPQLAPGESATRTFVVDAGNPASRFFSWAAMVIPSNDAFIGNDDPQAHRVFDNGGGFLGDLFTVAGAEVRDAGTEVNDEVPAHTAFFGQQTPDSGVDENGVVHDHPGYLPPGSGGILDDPQFAAADFTVPGYETARVTIYRSDTIIAGGLVSGTWSAADSPFIVQGDVTVPTGETLVIEPGVLVYTEAGHGIKVSGSIEAIGTADAPITFTGPTGSGWRGLRIEGPGSSGVLEHCLVERGDRESTYERGGGIACVDGSLELRHSFVRQNRAFLAGAGIYALNADLVIEDCDIGPNFIDSSNSATGGGLHAEGSQLELRDSRIHDNRVETFTSFGATNSRGGGLALIETTGTVDHCLVDGNYITHSGTGGESTGGGIHVDAGGISDGPLLRGNTIVNNEVNYTNAQGGGIYLVGYYAELVDNVIASNIGAGVWFAGGAETTEVRYNDVWNNSDGDLAGGFVPSGLGQIVQTNANGDPCDASFNIFLDPEFVAPGADDYHLMAASPCIDAGDPDSPADPDGTVADIGAFYFAQDVTSTPPVRDAGTRILMGARPAPMTGSTSIVYSLPEAGPVRLEVYDVRGRNVRQLVDRAQPAGQHAAHFDGRDDGGRELPAGVYLYRLMADGRAETEKITILR